EQARDDRNQSGLSATARPDQERKFPLNCCEIHTAKDFHRGFGLAETFANFVTGDRRSIVVVIHNQRRKTMAGSRTSTRRRLRKLARMTTKDMQPPVKATLCHMRVSP